LQTVRRGEVALVLPSAYSPEWREVTSAELRAAVAVAVAAAAAAAADEQLVVSVSAVRVLVEKRQVAPRWRHPGTNCVTTMGERWA
jgi:hypothetical protein